MSPTEAELLFVRVHATRLNDPVTACFPAGPQSLKCPSTSVVTSSQTLRMGEAGLQRISSPGASPNKHGVRSAIPQVDILPVPVRSGDDSLGPTPDRSRPVIDRCGSAVDCGGQPTGHTPRVKARSQLDKKATRRNTIRFNSATMR
jgi:hypothetical protein